MHLIEKITQLPQLNLRILERKLQEHQKQAHNGTSLSPLRQHLTHNLPEVENETDMQVKSPFYEKRNHKTNCGCPYHRLQRVKQVPNKEKSKTNLIKMHYLDSIRKRKGYEVRAQISDCHKSMHEGNRAEIKKMRQKIQELMTARKNSIQHQQSQITKVLKHHPSPSFSKPSELDTRNQLFEAILKIRLDNRHKGLKYMREMLHYLLKRVKAEKQYCHRSVGHIQHYLNVLVNDLDLNQLKELDPQYDFYWVKIMQVVKCSHQRARDIVQDMITLTFDMEAYKAGDVTIEQQVREHLEEIAMKEAHKEEEAHQKNQQPDKENQDLQNQPNQTNQNNYNQSDHSNQKSHNNRQNIQNIQNLQNQRNEYRQYYQSNHKNSQKCNHRSRNSRNEQQNDQNTFITDHKDRYDSNGVLIDFFKSEQNEGAQISEGGQNYEKKDSVSGRNASSTGRNGSSTGRNGSSTGRNGSSTGKNPSIGRNGSSTGRNASETGLTEKSASSQERQNINGHSRRQSGNSGEIGASYCHQEGSQKNTKSNRNNNFRVSKARISSKFNQGLSLNQNHQTSNFQQNIKQSEEKSSSGSQQNDQKQKSMDQIMKDLKQSNHEFKKKPRQSLFRRSSKVNLPQLQGSTFLIQSRDSVRVSREIDVAALKREIETTESLKKKNTKKKVTKKKKNSPKQKIQISEPKHPKKTSNFYIKQNFSKDEIKELMSTFQGGLPTQKKVKLFMQKLSEKEILEDQESMRKFMYEFNPMLDDESKDLIQQYIQKKILQRAINKLNKQIDESIDIIHQNQPDPPEEPIKDETLDDEDEQQQQTQQGKPSIKAIRYPSSKFLQMKEKIISKIFDQLAAEIDIPIEQQRQKEKEDEGPNRQFSQKDLEDFIMQEIINDLTSLVIYKPKTGNNVREKQPRIPKQVTVEHYRNVAKYMKTKYPEMFQSLLQLSTENPI